MLFISDLAYLLCHLTLAGLDSVAIYIKVLLSLRPFLSNYPVLSPTILVPLLSLVHQRYPKGLPDFRYISKLRFEYCLLDGSSRVDLMSCQRAFNKIVQVLVGLGHLIIGSERPALFSAILNDPNELPKCGL